MWHDKVLTLLLWATQSTFCMGWKFFFMAYFKILFLKMDASGLVEWAFQKNHGIFEFWKLPSRISSYAAAVVPPLHVIIHITEILQYNWKVLPGKPFEMTWQFNAKYHNCSVLHRSHGIISTWQLKCYLGNSVFDFLLYCRIL